MWPRGEPHGKKPAFMRTNLRRGTVAAVLASLMATTAFGQGTTLWLVRPLYPGDRKSVV